MARFVDDHINKWVAGFLVDRLQDLARDFDQVGIERPLVPCLEQLANLGGGAFVAVTQKTVDFGDHLHISVFDAVVHSFHKVARAIGAEVIGTGLTVVFGRNRLKDIADNFERGDVAARHNGGTKSCPLFAARDAHTDEIQTIVFQRGFAAAGVVEIGVARIDDHIAFVEVRL